MHAAAVRSPSACSMQTILLLACGTSQGPHKQYLEWRVHLGYRCQHASCRCVLQQQFHVFLCSTISTLTQNCRVKVSSWCSLDEQWLVGLTCLLDFTLFSPFFNAYVIFCAANPSRMSLSSL